LFNPISYFLRAYPEDLQKHLNELVKLINNNFQALGFGYIGTVTNRQFKLALAASTLNHTVIAGIPASSDDPIYIAWTSGATVTPNDLLATNVQATLGYSPAQMAALFALAETQTP
jgi:acyl-coenzyme A synthetase/AMP-(fatty) acid ligase